MVGVVGSSPIVPTKIHETEFEKSNSVFFYLPFLLKSFLFYFLAPFSVTSISTFASANLHELQPIHLHAVTLYCNVHQNVIKL